MATGRQRRWGNIYSVNVEKSWYECTNTAYQILPQDTELLCIDLAATALQAWTITWFCCQAARWMLRPNLPVASCGPGSGPINPLGLLSAFVSGLERLSGGYNQHLEADHSEVSEALHSLTSQKSQLTNFGFNAGLWTSAESNQVSATVHTYGCSMFWNTHVHSSTQTDPRLQSVRKWMEDIILSSVDHTEH